MIKDRNIHYKYKKDFVPVATFTTFDGRSTGTGADDTLQDAVSEASLFELPDGGNGLGVVGLKQGTAGNIARNFFPLPSYWDTGNDIHVRVWWTEEGTSTSEITYNILYEELSLGAAPAAGSTELDTPLVADPHCGVANGINATKWGTINADSLSADYLIVDVEMEAESAGSLNAVLLGIEWAYLPKLTDGAQNKLTDDPTDA